MQAGVRLDQILTGKEFQPEQEYAQLGVAEKRESSGKFRAFLPDWMLLTEVLLKLFGADEELQSSESQTETE